VIGRRQKRLDGFEKVSGRSVFTDDVRLPGMLHGKILRSPHARARIISIDTSAAESLPGVKVVLTGRDAPHLMYSEHQPVLAQGKSPDAECCASTMSQPSWRAWKRC